MALSVAVSGLLDPAYVASATTGPAPAQPTLPITLCNLVPRRPSAAMTIRRLNDRGWPEWIGYGIGFLFVLLVIANHFGFFLASDEMAALGEAGLRGHAAGVPVGPHRQWLARGRRRPQSPRTRSAEARRPGHPSQRTQATMTTHDPVSVTQALVRCPSVTPAEGGALTLLESILKPAGFACHRMTFTEPGTLDVENLYARIGTGAPHLCFAGHTDVVPVGDEKAWTRPPFGAEIVDGVLFGRGAIDMKGGDRLLPRCHARSRRRAQRPATRLAFVPHHQRRGRAVDQRHGQGARLAQGARGDDRCGARGRRALLHGRARRRHQGRPARQPQRRAGRLRQAGARGLSTLGRQPDPAARADDRPAVHDRSTRARSTSSHRAPR